MKKFLLLIMLLAASLPAWAEEKVISLDEVVVTAARTDEEIVNVPANITVITQEEIKKSTASTVQDLLRSEEGVILRDLYGTGTKSVVDIRGFAKGTDTVVLLDGRRINAIDSGGVDWNLLPLENIDRIEIIRGSESVLYGDNAMAGAINIITKKGGTNPPDFIVNARAESYSGHTEDGSFSGGNDWLGYYFLMKHRETDGYRENSSFNATDMNTRLNFKISRIFSMDFAAGYHEDQQGLPGGLLKEDLKEDRRQSVEPWNKVHYNQRFADLKGSLQLGSWGELELGCSFDNVKFNALYFSNSTEMNRDTTTTGLHAKLTADTHVLSMRSLTIAGIDFFDFSVSNSSEDILGTWGSSADLSKQDSGFYIQNELFLTKALSLSAGYRYDEAKYADNISNTSIDFGNSSGSDDIKFTEDAIKVGINYNYAPASKIFFNYSKGYRLPTTDELIDFMGKVKFLKPEKADTYETGIAHSFANKVQLRATAYLMNVKDELFVDPTLNWGFGENQNIDKTRHYGVETGFSAPISDNISVFGSFTYSEAKFKSGPYDGNNIPMVPHYSASIGSDFKIVKNILLAVKGNWVDKRHLENDVANDLPKLESHVTFDSKLSYTHKNMTAYLGINNILNRKYSDYGAHSSFYDYEKYYPATERNFYGGLKIVF